MALPELDGTGWLPDGIYEATLEEIESRFGRFNDAVTRTRLFKKLEAYVGELKEWGIATAVYVDGSFVSGKPNPSDIDVVVCLRAEFLLRSGEWRPHETNLVDHSFTKRTYELDMFPVLHGPQCEKRVGAFLEKKEGSGRKGLLRVSL